MWIATAVEVKDEDGATVEKYSPRRCQASVFGVERRVSVNKTPFSCRDAGGRAQTANDFALSADDVVELAA